MLYQDLVKELWVLSDGSHGAGVSRTSEHVCEHLAQAWTGRVGVGRVGVVVLFVGCEAGADPGGSVLTLNF